MNNSNQRKSGAVLSYVSIILNTLIALIYTPFMLRIMGQSEYGLYSLVASIISYLTVLDLGFGNAIIVYTSKYRAMGKYEEEKKLHGMFFIIFCIIAVVAGIGGLILYFNVDNLFGNSMTSIELSKAKVMMLILTFNLVITFVFSIYSSIITAYEKFVFQKVVSIIRSLLNPIIMLPLLFMGYRSITMTIVITILNVAMLLLNYFYCKKKLNINIKFSGFDKVLFKEIIGYSFWIFLSVIVDKANWSVDQFILGAISGTVAVSIYSVASQINQLFINLSTSISGVLLPKMSKMVANGENRLLSDEFIKIGRLQYLIIFLMASCLVLFGKEFIILWAGDNYVTSYYVTIILVLPASIPLIQNLGLSIMQAMNKFKFRAITTFFMAIFNIIISIFLAKQYGAIGSAIGTAIALIICNCIIMNIYYKKEIKLDIGRFWQNILKMTLPFIVPIVLILLFEYFCKLSGILSIVVYGMIYFVMYIFVAYKFVMDEYEKNLFNNILIKLHLKKVTK
jgi:O-antigen/teichoic acid export membrane protein